MKKKPLSIAVFLALPFASMGQKVEGKLNFQQGQVLDISVEMKTTIAQQAMGQAIDFTLDAGGYHSYKVTNATEEVNTLNHQLRRITFTFDGMGQKRSFDSDVPKDLEGPLGKPIREVLEKKYDMVIDPGGKTLMTLPEKIQLAADDKMPLVSGMLKDILDLVQPPAKGESSFFRVLPDSATGKGEPWTESYTNEKGKFDAAYNISDINDSTIVVDFAANSVTVTRAEMMGNETTTTMNNKSTGRIILDRATRIIREKTINTESNGNLEASFGTLPVTSKSITVIKVATAH